MATVYILYSQKTKRYYIGSTTRFSDRLIEHNAGQTKSTKSGRPWECVFQQEVGSATIAKQLESRLKKYKSKEIIERIIREGCIRDAGVAQW